MRELIQSRVYNLLTQADEYGVASEIEDAGFDFNVNPDTLDSLTNEQLLEVFEWLFGFQG